MSSFAKCPQCGGSRWMITRTRIHCTSCHCDKMLRSVDLDDLHKWLEEPVAPQCYACHKPARWQITWDGGHKNPFLTCTKHLSDRHTTFENSGYSGLEVTRIKPETQVGGENG